MAVTSIIFNLFGRINILNIPMPVLAPIFKNENNFPNCYFKVDQQK